MLYMIYDLICVEAIYGTDLIAPKQLLYKTIGIYLWSCILRDNRNGHRVLESGSFKEKFPRRQLLRGCGGMKVYEVYTPEN